MLPILPLRRRLGVEGRSVADLSGKHRNYDYTEYDDYDYDGYDIEDLEYGIEDTEEEFRDSAERFEMSYKEFHPKKKRTRLRVRWDNVAIAALAVVLALLLVFLVLEFRQTHSGGDDSSDEAPAAATLTGSATTAAQSSVPDVTVTDAAVTEPEPEKPLFPVEKDVQVIDGVTYMNGIVIINKSYGVPASYDPGVNPVAEAKLQEMYQAAAEDGLTLWTASGYRTYEYQKELYEEYARRDGYAAADTYSARPGFSEHESGFTFDVNDPSSEFNGSEEAEWLAEHCAEYGFIIRYPEGKEDITGFIYEAWHVRYVGEDIAKVIMENGITLEEYFGITSEYAD